MKRLSLTWMGLLAATVVLAGCSRGPRTYPVSGTVKLDGNPLSGARVVFSDPSLSHTAVGTTDAAGNFVLAYLSKVGAPEGNYKVSIDKLGPSSEIEDMQIELVPARYNRATTLTAQVQNGGANVFNFDHLTSEKDELDAQGRAVRAVDPDAEPPDSGEQKNPGAEEQDPLLRQLDRAQDRDGDQGG